MTHETWYDGDAGPLVRPYTVTGGRTRPGRDDLNMITMVMALTGRSDPSMTPEHGDVVAACQEPRSIAEIAADVGLPITVVKILVSDLMERAMVTSRRPLANGTTSAALLRTMLDRVNDL